MMHSKLIILLLALLANSMVLQAKQLSAAEALQRLKSNNLSKRVGAHRVSPLSLSYIHKLKDSNIFYAFNDTVEGGYILLSADNAAPAILAKVNSGMFSMTDMPKEARLWLEAMSNHIETAIKYDIPLYSSNTRAGGRQTVNPLLSTTWGQGTPYNDMCPVCFNGEKSVSGCVATAMAQIMYYHKWPSNGIGSHTYRSRSNGFIESADFGNTTYQWDLMQDHYGQTSLDGSKNAYNFEYSSSSAEAVATLMRHCGVSVDMDYDYSASGTYSFYVPQSLISYFSYDKGVNIQFKIWYSDEIWDDMLYQELSDGRPIYYGGNSQDGGHAFVCDGYSDGYYHFNWGWDGIADGYYLITGIDAMHPRFPDTGDYVSGAFTMYNEAIFGIQKPATNTEVLVLGIEPYSVYSAYSVHSGDGFKVSKLKKDDIGNIVFDSGLYNFSNRDIAIFLGVRFVNIENGEEYYTTYGQKYTCDVSNGIKSYSFTTSGVPDGKYRVYPVFGETKEDLKDIKIAYGTEIPVVTIGNSSDPEPDPEPEPEPGDGDTDISQYPNVIYTTPMTQAVGSDFNLSIKMKNEVEISSFQFDIILPDGISFVNDENGNPNIELIEERSTSRRHIVSSKMQDNGILRVICFSAQNNVFTGNDGDVLNMPLTISDDMPLGKYQIGLSNIRLATAELSEFVVPEVKTTIEITERWKLGDVNDDGVIDIIDVTALVNLVINSNNDYNYNRRAADVNGDGVIDVIDVTALINIILGE